MAENTVHRVKAAAVVVKTGGTERYLYKGAVLPPGTPGDEIKRLVSIGLVEEVTVQVALAAESGTSDEASKPQARATKK